MFITLSEPYSLYTRIDCLNLKNTDTISKVCFSLILRLKPRFLHSFKQTTRVSPSKFVRTYVNAFNERTPSLTVLALAQLRV